MNTDMVTVPINACVSDPDKYIERNLEPSLKKFPNMTQLNLKLAYFPVSKDLVLYRADEITLEEAWEACPEKRPCFS